MANFFNIRLFMTGLFFVFFTTACEEDVPDPDDNDPRSGITGSWKVNEDSELFKKSTKGFYTVNISKDPANANTLLISNFYEVSGKLSVTIDGRSLSISEQTLSGYTIKGNGLISYSFNKIDWSYTVNLNTGQKDNVTAVYSR